MSDTAINSIIQYGTTAERGAFTPDPAVGSRVLYLFYDTDDETLYAWIAAAWEAVSAGAAGISQLTGDVTAGPGSGSQVATIAANAVTDGMLRDSSALSVIGRSANSSGDPADIAAASDNQVLRRSGTSLGFGTVATDGLTNNAVTDAKLRQSGALSVIGRSANSTGDVADISAASDDQVLRRSGTSLGFGTVATGGIANDAVTYAKIQNVSASPRLLGRATASAGDVEELTLGAGLMVSGTTVSSTAFVRKTSDESVANSTSLQADDELTVSIPASETWEFEFNIYVVGAVTGDFRCGLKFPTTPTAIAYGIMGSYTDLATDGGTLNNAKLTSQGPFTADAVNGLVLGATTSGSVVRLRGFVVNSTNAGSITLWWAQGTSDGTNTTVKAGSYLVARKVA